MRGWTDLDSNDEYARIQVIQNQGGVCPYCHSEQGHYARCPLLSMEYPRVAEDAIEREMETEAKKVTVYRSEPSWGYSDADVPDISDEDKIRLSGMGVTF